MKWFGRRSDKTRILALQDACERVLLPSEESLERFLAGFKSIVGDRISFTEGLRTDKVVEESQILDFLFDGSGEERKILCELLRTRTGERVVLLLRSLYSGSSRYLMAEVGFGDLHSRTEPIVWRARLSDYSKFMDEMSKRPVLDYGLTKRQHEMASSLVRSRLAHSFSLRSSITEYGLTLAGKAVRVAIKWRFITFPVAGVFAILVISSNVNSTLDLVCRIVEYEWCC